VRANLPPFRVGGDFKRFDFPDQLRADVGLDVQVARAGVTCPGDPLAKIHDRQNPLKLIG
jgi:hypothetical protein